MVEEKRKAVDDYIIGLRENPPIEYVAEFLCNIFQYKPKTETSEAYFCDGMGRTFYETILGLFSNKSSSYDKMFELTPTNANTIQLNHKFMLQKLVAKENDCVYNGIVYNNRNNETKNVSFLLFPLHPEYRSTQKYYEGHNICRHDFITVYPQTWCDHDTAQRGMT